MFQSIDVDSGTSVWETAQLRKFALPYHSGQNVIVALLRKVTKGFVDISLSFSKLSGFYHG
jgi:hypothetical protein